MSQITVKELYEYLRDVIRVDTKNANKKIVLSDDNEGNGYHGMFYLGVVEPKEVAEFIDDVYDSAETNPDNLVILG